MDNWTSRLEVLQRVIRMAAIRRLGAGAALGALDRLQASLRLRGVNLAQRERNLKAERLDTARQPA